MKNFLSLVRETIKHSSVKNTSRMGAALAYYAVFSIAPLLLIFISLVGIFIDKTFVLQAVSHNINTLFGASVGEYITDLVQSTSTTGLGFVGTILSIATILYGALAMFSELDTDLDELWKVESTKKVRKQTFMQTVVTILKEKGLQFLLIIAVAGVFILALIGGIMLSHIPLYSLLANAMTFFLSVVIFAVVYRILPNLTLPWSEIWLGALVTSVLFFIGRIIIGFYLQKFADVSVYGTAGAFAAILIWIYYSARVFFLGASFIFVHSKQNGVLREN